MSGKFPSKKSFDLEFNLIWNKHKIITSVNYSSDLLLSLKNKCNKVYKFFTDLKSFEVICHNQTFEYTNSCKTIKVPLTIIRQASSILSIYCDKEVSYSKDSAMYPIVYSLIMDVTNNLLSGFNYSRKPCILKLQTFSIHSYSLVGNLPNVVDNIIIGLDNVRYPKIGSNCKICNRKLECPWFND